MRIVKNSDKEMFKMQKLLLTEDHFNSDNKYIGKDDLLKFAGDIEIVAYLGCLEFKSICVKGSILVKDGTSIKADQDVIAEGRIKIGGSIEARDNIISGDRLIVDKDI